MIFMHYVYEHTLLENKTGQAKNKILGKTSGEMIKCRAYANNACRLRSFLTGITAEGSLHTALWWSMCTTFTNAVC